MTLKEVVSILGSQGITKVEIRYSGSGDSGDVEEIKYFVGSNQINIVDHVIDPLLIADKVGKQAAANLKRKKIKLEHTYQSFDLPPIETIKSALGSATDLIDGDWYNNEGGQGTITIYTKTGKVIIDAEFNVMNQEQETQEAQL